jgi:hypothetical protein
MSIDLKTLLNGQDQLREICQILKTHLDEAQKTFDENAEKLAIAWDENQKILASTYAEIGTILEKLKSK